VRLADAAFAAVPDWRSHRLFGALLCGGVLLRLAATIAYWPALTFYGDSYSYLRSAATLTPDPTRPFGYPAMLSALSWSPTLAVVPVSQHLLGLATGILLYGWLRHRGVSARLASLGTAPVLLDAYQVDVEQMVMAETLFGLLLLAALATLTWRGRPGPVSCTGAGLLLAGCALTRTVALGLVVLAAVYLVARSVGPRRLALFGLGVAVPLLGYATWFATERGSFALQTVDGLFLWGRVAPIAPTNCDGLDVSSVQARMCSPHPAAQRPGPTYYDWHPSSPRFLLTRDRRWDSHDNALLRDLAWQVVSQDPVGYGRLVLADTVHYFAPVRRTGPHDWYLGSWQFPVGPPDVRLQLHHRLVDFDDRAVPRRYVPALGGLLRGYQEFGFTPGPVLAGCVGLGLLATVALAGYGTPRARHECLLLVTTGVALLVLPSATAVFDYRYLLPTLVCLPPAGVLAVHQLRTAGRQSRAARRSPAAAAPANFTAAPRPALPVARVDVERRGLEPGRQ
jgi:hypothetical protein